MNTASKRKRIHCVVVTPDANITANSKRAPVHVFFCAVCQTERNFQRHLLTETEHARALLYCQTCNHAQIHFHQDNPTRHETRF